MAEPKFVRRFKSLEEESEELEKYKKELSRELSGVERRLKELRTGAATENGREVVLGTVFMLMGENAARSPGGWPKRWSK